MARWRNNKAEFGTERTRYDHGKDDITPKHLGELGFDEDCKPNPDKAVDYVMRKVYQEVMGETAPTNLTKAKVESLKSYLKILSRKNRRLRLVIDCSDLDGGQDLERYAQFIHSALPELYLIFTDSNAMVEEKVFVVPESELNAHIYDCLIAIESCT
jgi:hypothetical protein